MPEINIEEKIQEALKRKSFKEHKAEYLGLTFIFCTILFLTFLVGYHLPFIGIFIFIFVDIPLMMGYKHFIWFGPASGETLIDGFKVSLICGFLNFISYMKIFITCNLKPLLWALLAFVSTMFAGIYIVELSLPELIQPLMEVANMAEFEQQFLVIMNDPIFLKASMIVEAISLGIAGLVFYFLKLNRGILPYVSFLRLTNLEGKSMDGVIANTKRLLSYKRFKYYLKATGYHLLYIIPFSLSALTYFLLSMNPVYSERTLTLMAAFAFFVTLFIPVLFVELNNRTYCITANQQAIKEQNKMLDDAMNDLKSKKR